MKPIQIISQDLFDKVRSRFSNLEMGDETGAVTIDPAEARFFDFDFVFEGNNLGRVSISLGDLGNLKVYYSQGITENQDDPVKKEWFRFLKEMRFFAMRRLLRFDTRDIAKTNLDKNDFQHLATTQGPKEEEMTTMNETKKIKKSVAENTGREMTNTPRDRLISRMSPSVDNNALLQKVGKVVNSPEFNSDTILQIVDSPNITHPVGRYIQKEFDELQYNLGRAYEDHPEEVAEKLLAMLIDRTQQGVAEGSHEDQVARLAAYNEKMAGENPPIDLGLREVGNWAKVGHYGDPIKTAWFNIAKYGIRNNKFNDSVDKAMLAIGDFPDKYDLSIPELDTLYSAYETVYDQWEQSKSERGVAEGLQESRWNHKSSSKTSRAVQGKTEVIMRHARPVEETFAGARSQKKNIKAIFIQNQDGERFKYPFIHPAGAFAMAQHVDHGGIPHDPAGKAIIKMSEQIAQLQAFQRKVHKATLHDDATGITERAVGRLQELKARVDGLSKRHQYECWMEEFTGDGSEMDMALDDVTMEQYKQKFTQTSFQEELSSFFPLLHSIMSEDNDIDLEEFVNEETAPWETDDEAAAREAGKKEKSPFKKPKNPNRTGTDTAKALAQKGIPKESFGLDHASPEQQFEDWADATEQGKLTDDQVDQLKQAIESLGGEPLQLGPDGSTAWQFFNELGLEDEDLEDKFVDAANVDPESDGMEVFKVWAQQDYPELAVALGMSGAEQPEQPEQPVAEGNSLVINGKEVDMRSLEIDGVDPRDYPDFSDAYISYASFTDGTDLSDEEMDQLNDEHGDLVHELAYDSLHENDEQGGMPNKTMPTREAVIKEVAKLVKSRFNEDNLELGAFNGAPNIALDVKKKCAEMFGEEVGEQAESLALEFMEKLSRQRAAKHGNVEDDGLARLKELLNTVKAKVEGIGDRGQSGKDFNTNIMPAEEVDKSQIPAKQRKDSGDPDWKVTVKDLDNEQDKSPTSSAGLAQLKKDIGVYEETALEAVMRLSNYKK